MNKRITEKVYKKKFQIVFAEVLNGLMDMHIKPSRVRLSVHKMDGEAMWMIGRAQGLEMKLRIYKKLQWEKPDD